MQIYNWEQNNDFFLPVVAGFIIKNCIITCGNGVVIDVVFFSGTLKWLAKVGSRLLKVLDLLFYDIIFYSKPNWCLLRLIKLEKIKNHGCCRGRLGTAKNHLSSFDWIKAKFTISLSIKVVCNDIKQKINFNNLEDSVKHETQWIFH